MDNVFVPFVDSDYYDQTDYPLGYGKWISTDGSTVIFAQQIWEIL